MPAISPVSAASPVQKGSAPAAQLREVEATTVPAPAGGNVAPIVNPSMRFDMKLGLVVVEFFDDSGEVATTIPSPQKLKAYEAALSGGQAHAPPPLAPVPDKAASAGTGEPRNGRDGLAVVA